MVTRSHAVAGRNIQKTIPQDRNFFMRHAIMRSCEHARRAPSADAAAQSQHAGHVSALGEAQLVVSLERPSPTQASARRASPARPRKATTVVPKRYRHLSKVPKRCPARTVGHPKVIKGARHVPGPIRELTSLILHDHGPCTAPLTRS